MPSHINREKALGNLAELREKIYNDTDPALLGEYRKLFKKKFSFFRRSWAAAWLFMYYDQRETPSINFVKSKNKKSEDSENANSGHPVVSLPEDESKRLFVNIGKNRRVYPREIISLFLSKTSAAREDIGLIRILDNYSFVQVRDTKADEMIEALNGIKFRGRNLTVNYAKPKEEAQ